MKFYSDPGFGMKSSRIRNTAYSGQEKCVSATALRPEKLLLLLLAILVWFGLCPPLSSIPQLAGLFELAKFK
jgi:hypothetical protein